MHISAGTDTYGRVKTVSGTPIVTKFAMFQFLPLYPLQSYYFIGAGRTETTGVPFLAGTASVAIKGVPLATLDATSVVMAYARGLFGALAVVGFMVIVPCIMYLTGGHADVFAMTATRAFLVCLITGTVGGLLTYVVPLTPGRERDIRKFCGELLGISADPARLESETSASLARYVGEQHHAADDWRTQLIRELISTRAMIAQAIDSDRMETKTDELLGRLRQADRIAA